VFDVLHRSGNVHDSNGAREFMQGCVANLRNGGYRGKIEMRMDGAHFSEQTCSWLQQNRIEFSVSVPFQRFTDAKCRILARTSWKRIDDEWSYFDWCWKPKSWPKKARCIVFRRKVSKPIKGPIQLDLFEPTDREFEYKMVMTNKVVSAKSVLHFHNGRGSQEGIFAELKSQGSLDYIPTRREIGNRVYLLACVAAHTLGREMQMRASQPQRIAGAPKRAALWKLRKLGTGGKAVLLRAGRLTRPGGRLTLTMANNKIVAKDFERLLRPWGKTVA